MTGAITITRREDGPDGRYEARVAGREGSGELTYLRKPGGKLIADHTGVDDSLRGTGVAAKTSRSFLCVRLSKPCADATPNGAT